MRHCSLIGPSSAAIGIAPVQGIASSNVKRYGRRKCSKRHTTPATRLLIDFFYDWSIISWPFTVQTSGDMLSVLRKARLKDKEMRVLML